MGSAVESKQRIRIYAMFVLLQGGESFPSTEWSNLNAIDEMKY